MRQVTIPTAGVSPAPATLTGRFMVLAVLVALQTQLVSSVSAEVTFLNTWGSYGDGEGQFNRPSNTVVDNDGNIFVADWGNQRVQVFDKDWTFQTSIRGAAELSVWAAEYIDANADEKEARSTFTPYPELDVDDPHEVSARTEPYFWDPVSVAIYDETRLLVLETGRHRFQVWEKV